MRPVGSAGSRSRPRRHSGDRGGGGDGPTAAMANGMPLGGGGGGGCGIEADGLAVLEEADDPLLEMGTIEAAQVRRIAAAAALRKEAGEGGDDGSASSSSNGGSSSSGWGPMSPAKSHPTSHARRLLQPRLSPPSNEAPIAEHNKGGAFEDD